MQVLQLTLGIRQYAPLLEVWRKQAIVDGAIEVSMTEDFRQAFCVCYLRSLLSVLQKVFNICTIWHW